MVVGIDTNKIKIKYILGSYLDAKDYPTSEDVMYFLIQHFMSSGDKDLEFTDHFLMNKLHKSRDEITILLDKCIVDKHVEHVKDTNIKSFYKLTNNPFI